MSHIMKYTEWQSASGRWYSGDVSDLGHGSNYWWYPARMLNMSITDYILMLKNDYHAFDFKYLEKGNVLIWNWTYNDCHRFTLMINKVARNTKFVIC